MSKKQAHKEEGGLRTDWMLQSVIFKGKLFSNVDKVRM